MLKYLIIGISPCRHYGCTYLAQAGTVAPTSTIKYDLSSLESDIKS